jgi:hypothetical protein
MVIHQGIYSRGVLLEEVTIPLGEGEIITLSPRFEAAQVLKARGADVAGHSLRIVGVGNVHVAGITFDRAEAILPVRALGPAHPGQNSSDWWPPMITQVVWDSPVRPGLHLEWTVDVTVSLQTYQHPYRDGRYHHLDSKAVRVPPEMLPPLVTVQWWCIYVESERP